MTIASDSLDTVRVESDVDMLVAGRILVATRVLSNPILFLGRSITVGPTGTIIGKTIDSAFSPDYSFDNISLRASGGDITLDGKLQYTCPHSMQGSGVQTTLRADGNITLGPSSKVTVRGKAASQSVLFVSTHHGDVDLKGRVSVHDRTLNDNGGHVEIRTCEGSVFFGNGSVTYFRGGANAGSSVAMVAAAQTITVGDPMNTSGGAYMSGGGMVLWGQGGVSISARSNVDVDYGPHVSSETFPPSEYVQRDRGIDCDPPPPGNIALDCTMLAEIGQPDVVQPWGVASAPGGDFYVVDLGANAVGMGTNTIKRFDISGAFELGFGDFGGEDGNFVGPYHIAVDSAGDLYVTDAGPYRVQKLDGDGNFITSWGGQGLGDGLFFGFPYGIAVSASGYVYVGDRGGGAGPDPALQNVHRFTTGGAFVSRFGGYGSGPGQFSLISSIVAKAGLVYVGDIANARVQVFDEAGNFIREFGELGDDYGQFMLPEGLTVDNAGNVYVSDGHMDRIQKFDSTGSFAGACGRTGVGAGNFNLPAGLAIDANGNLLVSDYWNYRLQRIAPF
jgi:hypothetical protein